MHFELSDLMSILRAVCPELDRGLLVASTMISDSMRREPFEGNMHFHLKLTMFPHGSSSDRSSWVL